MGFSTRHGFRCCRQSNARSRWLSGGLAMYTASTSESHTSDEASVYLPHEKQQAQSRGRTDW